LIKLFWYVYTQLFIKISSLQPTHRYA
jgi:hypothetical protein